MRKKIVTVVLVAVIASTATVGCGRTIQRVAGTINGVVQTDEFATAADSVSDALWNLATSLADAVCDFCKGAFGGNGDNQETENLDTEKSDSSGEAKTESTEKSGSKSSSAGPSAVEAGDKESAEDAEESAE